MPVSTGKALDEQTRASAEPRLGLDLRHVRVHTDARADQAARSLDARACCELVIAPGDDVPEIFAAALKRNLDGGIRGLHLCFAAPTRQSVDAFHAAAVRTGGRDNGTEDFGHAVTQPVLNFKDPNLELEFLGRPIGGDRRRGHLS